jgi:hypothetical protein
MMAMSSERDSSQQAQGPSSCSEGDAFAGEVTASAVAKYRNLLVSDMGNGLLSRMERRFLINGSETVYRYLLYMK